MMNICKYAGTTPQNNVMCNSCPLFIECCLPIASEDGYGLGSELDCILCEGCQHDCTYKESTTLYGFEGRSQDTNNGGRL
ncbi:hypothetical protein [Vallitalea guaymasensis]|uniref:hypothetical protein n=1 Tax=Vallitalea guaymasensis TaxID=1185412 RepID=UPI000DE487EA|nr:hypothetical protein [Vallitalea guaymasensis]